jgi:hypothetical protein
VLGVPGTNEIVGAPGSLVVRPVAWESGVIVKRESPCHGVIQSTIADMTMPEQPQLDDVYEKCLLCEVVSQSHDRIAEGRAIAPIAKKGQGVIVIESILLHAPSTPDGSAFIGEWAVIGVVAFDASTQEGELIPDPSAMVE